MVDFLVRTAITAAALWVAVVRAARRSTSRSATTGGSSRLVAIVFGLINSLIKPVVKLLALPVRLMTMGLITFVINAAMLLLLAYAAKQLGLDFTIGGFPPEPRCRRGRRCDAGGDRRVGRVDGAGHPRPRPAHRHVGAVTAGLRARRSPRSASAALGPALRSGRAAASGRPHSSPTSPRWTRPRPALARGVPRPVAAAVLGQGERRARRSSPGSAGRGLGANVVSAGEWAIARRAGL